jgi:molecular chaperone GrpE
MSQDNSDEPLPEETPPMAGAEEASEIGAQLIGALKAEVEAMKDRSLRALAEAENVRKRMERERDEARIYGVTRFARDLLTVADNLDRALAAAPASARLDADTVLKPMIEGVEATARELSAVLARHGVKTIDAAGQKFDPHLHQAIAEVPAPGQPPGTVVNVVQAGYTIADRLLRPSMVTVAKADAATRPGAARPNGDAAGSFDTKV